MPLTPEEVADQLFAAMDANDTDTVASLYSPNLQLWHSFDKQVRGRDECLAMIDTLGRIATRRYRLLESVTAGNRVIRRYELSLNSKRWSNYLVDLAVFLTVEDGKLVAMEEYIDSSDAAEAMSALEDAGISLPKGPSKAANPAT